MRGQPDFGMYAAKETTTSISDMGEVAARLGSIVTYDKRGDVVDFDNFEEPVLKWFPYGDDAGWYVRLDSTNVRSGSQAVKLYCIDEIGAYVSIEKQTQVVGSKRLGVEISFCYLTPYCDFVTSIHLYDGARNHTTQLRIEASTGKVYLMTYDAELDVEVEVEIADFEKFALTPNLFYTFKLVMDFNTDKYVRLLYTNHEYDLSQYSFWSEIDTRTPFFEMKFELRTTSAFENTIWLDDWVFTQAEP